MTISGAVSKPELYREYKSLSNGIFEPVVDKENLPASHYRKQHRKFQRCANKRSEFQQLYVPPEERDRNHIYAIESALKRSDEAKSIFINKHHKELHEKHSVNKLSIPTTDNLFTKLAHEFEKSESSTTTSTTTPATVIPVTTITPAPTPAPVATAPVVKEAIEDDDAILEKYHFQTVREIHELTALMISILRSFWEKQESIRGGRLVIPLVIVTWTSLAVENVPLNAAAFLKKLKNKKFVNNLIKLALQKEYLDQLLVDFFDEFYEYERKLKSTASHKLSKELITDLAMRGSFAIMRRQIIDIYNSGVWKQYVK